MPSISSFRYAYPSIMGANSTPLENNMALQPQPITLALSSETQEKLKKHASQSGQTVEEYITRLVVKDTLSGRSSKRTFAKRFQNLVKTWKQESLLMSSAAEMAKLPSYQQIIKMGESALPLILCELEKDPGHWFWALIKITGIDPVPPENRGDVRKMAFAWLNWGKQHGYTG